MKRVLFLFFCVSFLLFTNTVFAKKMVKGTIVSVNNNPIFGVSIYLNYTTISTFTKENGSFELLVEDDNFDVIISKKGYEIKKISISEFKKEGVLKIILIEKVIKKKKLPKNVWAYNFDTFKDLFLGKTLFSKECSISNPEVLQFSFDVSKGYLKATTSAPLIIKNKGLGYIIHYDLIQFESTSRGTSYNGYARFEDVKVNQMLKRRIDKNRKRAYNGSQIHFFKALQDDNLEKEGFFIDEYKRYPNPKRPTEKVLHRARVKVMKNFSSITYLKDIKYPKTALDSAIGTLRKISLHTHIEELVKKRVSYFDMIDKNEAGTFLKFTNYIKIYYTKEGEEKGFYQSVYSGPKRKQGYQITNIKLLTEKEALNKNGSLLNPLHLLIDGYWAYERIGDKLPLNYISIEK